MKRMGMMSRIAAVVLGLAVAVATLSLASAQTEPQHRFYGGGANPGDVITALISHDDHYDAVGSYEVGDDGTWYIDVDGDIADDVVWEINGEHADAAKNPTGATQTEITLTVHMEEDDSMMDEGDEMMGDDEMGEDEMMGEDEEMLDEEDSMMEDGDDKMDGDAGYPGTGSGGLADSGGLSAGLIGLLIALGAAALAGLGLRRVRNRA